MNKIYSDDGCLWVDDLHDIYYIKCVDKESNQETYEILTWTRMVDLSEVSKKPVRKYDIEFNDKKYYFLLFEDGDRYRLEIENSFEIDELCREKNIIITAETK
jgi:hypothetical protein